MAAKSDVTELKIQFDSLEKRKSTHDSMGANPNYLPGYISATNPKSSGATSVKNQWANTNSGSSGLISCETKPVAIPFDSDLNPLAIYSPAERKKIRYVFNQLLSGPHYKTPGFLPLAPQKIEINPKELTEDAILLSQKKNGQLGDFFEIRFSNNNKLYSGRLFYLNEGFVAEFPLGSGKLLPPQPSLEALFKSLKSRLSNDVLINSPGELIAYEKFDKLITTDPHFVGLYEIEMHPNLDSTIPSLFNEQSHNKYLILTRWNYDLRLFHHSLCIKHEGKVHHFDLFYSDKGFQVAQLGLHYLTAAESTIANLVKSLEIRLKGAFKPNLDGSNLMKPTTTSTCAIM